MASYITVGQLNNYLKRKFEADVHLEKVYLKGEISNCKLHSRGHIYFSLKDETSVIGAIMFAGNASSLKFEPKDGTKVFVEGKVTVYEASGKYQIIVTKMEPDGIGELFIAYEKLKKELEKEGLFKREYKKQIPKYPRKIGIITAPTGAAIRDILSTIKRRYPICETILFPALVQGELAKNSIVDNINKAQNYDLDVLIVGRGGGSIEDLWAFNEEIVARAIFASKIPIISAVGHEVDFTIADFVADLRAPTPTGAAEMAVPNMVEVFKLLDNYKVRLNQSVQNNLKSFNKMLENLKNSYVLKNPMGVYEVKEQRLSNLIDRLNNLMLSRLEFSKERLNNVKNSYVLKNPGKIYDNYFDLIKNYQNKLNIQIQSKLNLSELKLNNLKEKQILKKPSDMFINSIKKYDLLINKLDLLSPLNVLKKGYAIVENKTSVKEITVGEKVNIKLKDGTLNALIEGKEEN